MKKFRTKVALLFGFVGPLLPVLTVALTAVFQNPGDFFKVLSIYPVALLLGGLPAVLTGVVYGYLVISESLPKRYVYLVHPMVGAALGGFFSAVIPTLMGALGGWDLIKIIIAFAGGIGASCGAVVALIATIWQRRAEARAQASTV